MAGQKHGTLPYYAVERGFWNRDECGTGVCPVCTKPGRWVGATFVPDDERGGRGFPPCFCATIHTAGGYAYDPTTGQVLRRLAEGI